MDSVVHDKMERVDLSCIRMSRVLRPRWDFSGMELKPMGAWKYRKWGPGRAIGLGTKLWVG